MHLSTSNKGWHSQWFYVKDDAAAPLPVFSGRFIVEASGSWKWGVPVKEKKNINDHLTALKILKERREGAGDHRRLPYVEGGAADESRAPPVPDGARGVA